MSESKKLSEIENEIITLSETIGDKSLLSIYIVSDLNEIAKDPILVSKLNKKAEETILKKALNKVKYSLEFMNYLIKNGKSIHDAHQFNNLNEADFKEINKLIDDALKEFYKIQKNLNIKLDEIPKFTGGSWHDASCFLNKFNNFIEAIRKLIKDSEFSKLRNNFEVITEKCSRIYIILKTESILGVKDFR